MIVPAAPPQNGAAPTPALGIEVQHAQTLDGSQVAIVALEDLQVLLELAEVALQVAAELGHPGLAAGRSA